jgi:hypothetical protein
VASRWHNLPELPLRLAIGPAPGSHPDTSLAKDLRALRGSGFGRMLCLLQTFELIHLPEEPTMAEYARAIRGEMCPDDAMLLVRWIRPGTIQSDEQEAFLYEIVWR